MASQLVEGLNRLDIKGSVITIGNFDGCHRGHAELISYAALRARALSLKSVVITFRTRAADILFSDPLPRLYPFKENKDFLEFFSPDYIIAVDFSENICRMGSQEFFNMLIDYYNPKEIVEGEDFRFGSGNKGSVGTLKGYGKEAGISVKVFPFLKYREKKISTSQIRQCIMDGNMLNAANMLGRHFSCRGKVEKGKMLGRTIGYPTANIQCPPNVVVPKEGSYLSRVKVGSGDRLYPAITFTGMPDFNRGSGVRIESHILDFDEDIYGKEISVYFYNFLRGKTKSASIEDVKGHIQNDELKAREIIEKE